MFKAIPSKDDPKAYNKTAFISSRLVCIDGCDLFDVSMQYPLLGFESAVKNCYVREEVFEKLKLAQGYLPEGYKLRIWDAWRPFSLQEELFEKYSFQIIKQFCPKNATIEEQKSVIAKYVSIPEKSEKEPPVHTTGGAVDVTLLKDGREVPMGTAFDAFSEKTKTDYFEKIGEDILVRNNRRILYNAMISAGFTNLPSEWWHYDFGDKFWAYYNNTKALYEGIYEKIRKAE